MPDAASPLSAGSPPRGTRAKTGLLLVAIVCLTFINAIDGAYVFDDVGAIVENKTIRELFSPQVLFPPGEGNTVGGRPVLNLSFAINHAIAGDGIWLYRITNILIHAANTVLVFLLVLRLLDADRERFELRDEHSWAIAFGTALLFGVHPIQAESVTYTVQRAESLAGLFYLLTWYWFVRYLDGENTLHMVPTLLFAGLGFASKEICFVLPFVLVATQMVMQRRGLLEALRSRKIFYGRLAIVWLILLVIILSMDGRGKSAGLAAMSEFKAYSTSQLVYVPYYFRLIFWPDELNADYGLPRMFPAGQLITGSVALLAIVGIAVAFSNWSRTGRLLWLMALLTLLPSSSLIPIRTQVAADHRMYLPMMAVAFLVSALFVITIRRFVVTPRRFVTVSASLFIGLGIALGIATLWRNTVFADELAFKQDVVAKMPSNPRARYNIAQEYLERTDYEEALTHALRMMDGLSEQQRFQYDIFYKKAIMIIARGYYELGRIDKSIEYLERGKQFADEDTEIAYSIGSVLMKLNPKEAIPYFKKAIELDPQNSEAHNNLGWVLQYQLAEKATDQESRRQLMQAAYEHYRKAVEVDDENAHAHNLLGIMQLHRNEVRAAEASFLRAVDADPDFEEPRKYLAAIRSRR